MSRWKLFGTKARTVRNFAVCAATAASGTLLVANAPSEQTVPAPTASAVMTSEVQKEILRNGEVGFVLTDIAYALGPDAKDSGACPNGMTGGLRALMDDFKRTPAGLPKAGESPQAYEGRLERTVSTAPNGQNLCMHPELGAPDPNWRMVSGTKLRVEGIDLDGAGTVGGKRAAAGSCSHQDFAGGVDNQFYRVVGCTTGFQSTGQANGWQTEMYAGSWGVLVRLKGVDDLQNDPDVEVNISANADPIQLSPDRKALSFATYAMEQNARYRATTRGRIANGVLTINPVDIRLHNVVASYFTDRVLRDARLRVKFTPEGGMEGILAGYTPVDDMFDVQYGARSARTADGQLAPERRRISTSVGRAGALGHTCNGAYYALKQAADGHPDANGKCTSISTQYRIRMAPAFVVDAKTQSVNAPLAVR
jgi:hypothetical protein